MLNNLSNLSAEEKRRLAAEILAKGARRLDEAKGRNENIVAEELHSKESGD